MAIYKISEMKINEEIHGISVDAKTRCEHYHGESDIIAIKFKCCGEWFPCYECHAALSGHAAEVWGIEERGEKAILCGNCEHQLTIGEYMACGAACPECASGFNPGCANHYHLYFE
jgi:uncharacterized CHY-type Zn-finger protein